MIRPLSINAARMVCVVKVVCRLTSKLETKKYAGLTFAVFRALWYSGVEPRSSSQDLNISLV